jgi:hypothetical protein
MTSQVEPYALIEHRVTWPTGDTQYYDSEKEALAAVAESEEDAIYQSRALIVVAGWAEGPIERVRDDVWVDALKRWSLVASLREGGR